MKVKARERKVEAKHASRHLMSSTGYIMECSVQEPLLPAFFLTRKVSTRSFAILESSRTSHLLASRNIPSYVQFSYLCNPSSNSVFPPRQPSTEFIHFAETLVVTIAATTFSFKANIAQEEMSQLNDFYKYAYADFHGAGTPCIVKTGPPWPIRTGGTHRSKYFRAPRPIYNHPIRASWRSIAWRIVAQLDALHVEWTTINPLAYANAGCAALICDFVVAIGVRPRSLPYDAAVAAAAAVERVLRDAGFPEIQVALIESVYRRSSGHGSGNGNGKGPARPIDLAPLEYRIPALRRPFALVPNAAIAPLAAPENEGAGGLFFCLDDNDNDDNAGRRSVALLTCAHVARPSPPFDNDNKSSTRGTEPQQPREDVVLLGAGAFDAAVRALTMFTDHQKLRVESSEKALKSMRAREALEEPDARTTRALAMRVNEISRWRNEIAEAEELLGEVADTRAAPAQRVFGSVLHAESIEVGAGEHKFAADWGFVLVDQNIVDWDKFVGNKFFVGEVEEITQWKNRMFPHPHKHWEEYEPDIGGFVQISGVVPESEFHSPQDVDVYDAPSLLAATNSRLPGATTAFGRVNGLESVTRYRYLDSCGVDRHQDALAYAVLGYDTGEGSNSQRRWTGFAGAGDSGAVVVGRDGRVVGVLTGGAGPADADERWLGNSYNSYSYVTPYWWLEERIRERFPRCSLFLPVED